VVKVFSLEENIGELSLQAFPTDGNAMLKKIVCATRSAVHDRCSRLREEEVDKSFGGGGDSVFLVIFASAL